MFWGEAIGPSTPFKILNYENLVYFLVCRPNGPSPRSRILLALSLLCLRLFAILEFYQRSLRLRFVALFCSVCVCLLFQSLSQRIGVTERVEVW